MRHADLHVAQMFHGNVVAPPRLQLQEHAVALIPCPFLLGHFEPMPVSRVDIHEIEHNSCKHTGHSAQKEQTFPAQRRGELAAKKAKRTCIGHGWMRWHWIHTFLFLASVHAIHANFKFFSQERPLLPPLPAPPASSIPGQGT